jgi:formyltetrahydrofolate-dependent phosphoribosylglycinamide formyltransferase
MAKGPAPRGSRRSDSGNQFRIAVFASGGGSNLRALLARFLPGASPEVTLVVSDQAESGALRRARQARIPTETARPEDFPSAESYGEHLLRVLSEHAIDLVVLAGFLRKLPANVVDALPGRIVNVHPALLPRFGGKGMYGGRVHAAVLAAGDKESGPSVHFVDAEYDHGPLIAQRRVPVLPSDTVETLSKRVLAAEHELLPEVVARLAAGTVRLGQDGKVEMDDPMELDQAMQG